MASALFHALGDPTRFAIVSALVKKEEICACKFTGITGRAQPTVSLHLRVLERNGIVVSRREGRKIFYRLKDRGIIRLIKSAEALAK